MSARELKQHEVMSRVSPSEIGLRDVATLMEVSYRKAKWIWKQYREEGARGLVMMAWTCTRKRYGAGCPKQAYGAVNAGTKARRKRRECRRHFGELVHFDGSQHTWFKERGAKCFLMNMVDDATSRTEALFSEEETIWGAVLRKWVNTPFRRHCIRTGKCISARANLQATIAWRSYR